MRFGLPGNVALGFVDQVFHLYPMTWQPSAWYSTATYTALISVAVVVAYSFKISLGAVYWTRSFQKTELESIERVRAGAGPQRRSLCLIRAKS